MGFIAKLLKKMELNDEKPAAVRALIKRPPRVRILPFHNTRFELVEPKFTDSDLEILNLSYSGIAFHKSDLDWPGVGKVLKGNLKIEEETHPVEFEIVHETGTLVGCQFQGELNQLQRAMFRYFLVELSALEMYEVNPKLLQEEKDGDPRWFRGEDKCDLFILEDEKGVVRFHLSILGNYFEGGREHPLQCGLIVDDSDEHEKPAHKASPLVRLTNCTPDSFLETVTRFLENVELLTDQQLAQIIDYLRSGL